MCLATPHNGRPDPFGIGRPLLHASELAFDHPESGERVSFFSPPAADFADALERFRDATQRAVEQLNGPARLIRPQPAAPGHVDRPLEISAT